MRRLLTLSITAFITTLILAGVASAKDLTVMSRNIYLGADLLPLAVYGDNQDNLPQFEVAAGGVWSTVEATDFPLRAKALASELKKTKPDFIGLQEAALWQRSATPTGAPNQVQYDYIKSLISEARKRGLQYRVAVAQNEFDFTAPTNLGYKIRFIQRDAILVRKGAPVKITKTMKRQYSESFKVATPVGIADSKRGWVAVDFKYGREKMRLVDTHLEAYGADIRVSQAKELIAGPGDSNVPLVVTGDFNSSPQDGSDEGDAYRQFTGAGFTSVFKTSLLTCCQDERLTNPTSKLSQAIDHIMIKPVKQFKVRRTGIVGAKERVNGLWPSDHAGVWARFQLKKAKG